MQTSELSGDPQDEPEPVKGPLRLRNVVMFDMMMTEAVIIVSREPNDADE